MLPLILWDTLDLHIGTHQTFNLGWDSPDVPLDPLEPHVYTFDAPKGDSIQNSIENKIWNNHSIELRIFNRIIHSQKNRKMIQTSKIRPKYGFGALLRPLKDNRPPEMD